MKDNAMKTMKTKSGKTYTKKQICEAIAYWKKILNEGNDSYYYAYSVDPYLYITKLNHCFAEPVRKVGASHGSKIEREDPETLKKKLDRYSTSTTENWKAAYQIVLDDNDSKKLFTCEQELLDLMPNRQGQKELFAASDDDAKAAVDEFKLRHPTAEVIYYKN